MATASEPERRAGAVRLAGDAIEFERSRGRAWRVGLADLLAVGELSTPHGPHADDLLVVFVRRDQSWVELPFDADGVDALLGELGQRLGAELALGLCHRVDWASRVMWPARLAETPLFVITEVPPGPGVLARLRARFVGTVNLRLADAVRALAARVERSSDSGATETQSGPDRAPTER